MDADKELGLFDILALGAAVTVKLTGMVCGVLLAAGSLIVIVAEYVPEDKELVA